MFDPPQGAATTTAKLQRLHAVFAAHLAGRCDPSTRPSSSPFPVPHLGPHSAPLHICPLPARCSNTPPPSEGLVLVLVLVLVLLRQTGSQPRL